MPGRMIRQHSLSSISTSNRLPPAKRVIGNSDGGGDDPFAEEPQPAFDSKHVKASEITLRSAGSSDRWKTFSDSSAASSSHHAPRPSVSEPPASLSRGPHRIRRKVPDTVMMMMISRSNNEEEEPSSYLDRCSCRLPPTSTAAAMKRDDSFSSAASSSSDWLSFPSPCHATHDQSDRNVRK
ncbi:Hypothetical protein, putative [Bodo saltans]|uniref:Uncharacterized protein n=1 Tax=Bodo saltans TaxID=75058 RepID=A0A0S4JRJ1_BODSA|nr:Hypothetical protein, putative [Bodo saltans]|eukprot:CUG92801.1 Hypothetical protein, putative [Bodo saltans]